MRLVRLIKIFGKNYNPVPSLHGIEKEHTNPVLAYIANMCVVGYTRHRVTDSHGQIYPFVFSPFTIPFPIYIISLHGFRVWKALSVLNPPGKLGARVWIL
jgi:hypothetical protein